MVLVALMAVQCGGLLEVEVEHNLLQVCGCGRSCCGLRR